MALRGNKLLAGTQLPEFPPEMNSFSITSVSVCSDRACYVEQSFAMVVENGVSGTEY